MNAASTIAIVGLCAGCSSDPIGGEPGSTNQKSDAGQPATTAPLGSGAMAASGQPAPSVARAALAGTWRADFESKKGTVTLDPGVAVPSWKNDDESKAVGRGSLELVVADDGTVSGTLSGALGQASVTGSAEDDLLTATFAPSGGAPESEQAMAGTLTLRRKGEALVGTLRASSGDAKLVRMASLELPRAGK